MRVDAERILIVLLGAIGDVTRALPLVQRLRHAYPRATLTWAIEPLSAPLLDNHPAVDQRIIFQRRQGVRAFLHFLREVGAVQPNLTLDLQRHLKSGVTSLFSRAPLRLGFDRRNSREGNWLFNNHHIAAQTHFSSKLQQFQAFGDWLQLPSMGIDFGLSLKDAEEQRVDALLKDAGQRFVAAFVGSSCDSRLWFPERTAAVADALARRGLATVLLGGPGDVEFARQVFGATSTKILDLTGRTSLRDLVGIFRRSAAAWGPDSGPMHIAAAAGTRVVSLWGATSAQRSAPWRSEDLILEGPAPCSPCYRKHCDIGRVCMQNIQVDAVVAKVIAAMPG